MAQHRFHTTQAHAHAQNPQYESAHLSSPLAQHPFDLSEHSSLSLPPPPAPIKSHQRSRTTTTLPPLFTRTQSSSPTKSPTLLPFLRPQSTRSLSPERVSAVDADLYEVAPTPPEEQHAKKKSPSTANKFASWFEGSSEPVNISLIPSPRKEKVDPVAETGAMENLFSASQDSLDIFTKRPQRRSSPSGPAPSPVARFSLFRKSSVLPVVLATADEDELGHLDIREALFPQGYPDNFSPATFKNLQLNAEGTLRRYQQAHLEQQRSLKSLTSTNISQADDLEAANTRNEHLKFQLEDMAERAAEQERAIADLRAQLAAQRGSIESRLRQQQSVRMVDGGEDDPEELETTPRSNYRRHRVSDISISGDSEVGSDASSVVSVFSEALSAAPSHMTSLPSPSLKAATLSSASGCIKCHGLGAHEAWDVVGVMKLESTALKSRIAELEAAQDQALDFLNGLKL